MSIIVPLNAIKAKEEADRYGSDLPGPYNASHLSRVLDILKAKGCARIMIPLATFRRMSYPKGSNSPELEVLLANLGKPTVHIGFDEVHEIYKKVRDKLPAAVNSIRGRYASESDDRLFVVEGMSASAHKPELNTERVLTQRTLLFGSNPTLVNFEKSEEEELLNDINPQRKHAAFKKETIELPPPAESDTDLEHMSTLKIGNSLFHTGSPATSALTFLAGRVLANQVHGDSDDGGKLFHTPSDPVPMMKMSKTAKGQIRWTKCKGYETWLVVHSFSQGTQVHLELLNELKEKEVDGLRTFTVHDLRMKTRVEVAKEIKEHKRDGNDMKAALKKAFADTEAQKGINIILVDKDQVHGTNDFSKNVHRVFAIGVFEEYELEQLHDRCCRACELEEGDLVAKEVVLVYLHSASMESLFTRNVKGSLSDELKEKVKKIKGELGEEGLERYRSIKDEAEHLSGIQLPGDHAKKYIDLVTDDVAKGEFKAEYESLVYHDSECERNEKGKVISCIAECKCVFGEDEEDE